MRTFARVLLVALVAGLAYVVYFTFLEYQTASRQDLAELERQLSVARKACVEGPAAGPSCAEAARLTLEIANRGRR